MRTTMVNARGSSFSPLAMTAMLVAALAACDRPVTAPNQPLTASSARAGTATNGALPDQYVIPGDRVFPEGVAYDQRTHTVFVSSTTNGTIYAGPDKDPTLDVFLPGGVNGRTTAIGLEVDSEGRLWVAGGGTGNIWIYDASTGALLDQLTTTLRPTFINDIAVDRNGVAYITDSQTPIIYRAVPDGSGGWDLQPWLNLTGTPAQYTAGFNLNGIVLSPNQKELYTIKSNTGTLFRIDIATKTVTQIDVGTTLPSGDGLWIRGNTIYVLQNAQEIISKIRVQPNDDTGTLVSQTTDPSFMTPTSLVDARGSFLVVNSQFAARTAGQPPVLPFTVSVVPIP